MGTDTIRLPDGRTVTMNRARGMGWVDRDGNLTDRAPISQSDEIAKQREQRARDWRRSQGLPEPESDADIVAAGRKPPKPKPAKPRNVDKDGNEITDAALLAEIEAKTAQIEAANAAE